MEPQPSKYSVLIFMCSATEPIHLRCIYTLSLSRFSSLKFPVHLCLTSEVTFREGLPVAAATSTKTRISLSRLRPASCRRAAAEASKRPTPANQSPSRSRTRAPAAARTTSVSPSPSTHPFIILDGLARSGLSLISWGEPQVSCGSSKTNFAMSEARLTISACRLVQGRFQQARPAFGRKYQR